MKNRRLPNAFLVFVLVLPCLLWGDFPSYSDDPYYSSNPFSFSVPESPAGFGDFFMVWDVDQDGLADFLFRSSTKLYVYGHDGTVLWDQSIPLSAGVNGSGIAVLDVDGDGDLEVVAPDTSDNLVIYAGADGTPIRTEDISVGSNQRIGYIAAANLQGNGDHEIILQTVDERHEYDGKGSGRQYYYINRNLIGLDLSTSPETVLWTVEQDRDVGDGEIYDGYWGQTHGAFLCGDIDNDGLDEVVGGNYIDHDGTENDLSYPTAWVGSDNYSVDHIDSYTIGDYLPNLPGLEWVITQEDMLGNTSYHTALMTKSEVSWRYETSLFSGSDQEPQNIAVGDFDTEESGVEVWCRSRFSDGDSHSQGSGQHPWMFDYQGNEFASNHYDMEDVLPDGFFTDNADKGEGLEMIWTIDWSGSSTNYIAGIARHEDGHLGVFDATDGSSIFTSISYGNVDAKNIYVADIAGDSREEIIFYDVTDGKIKVFWNEDSFTDNNPNKWDDPLYKRLKQNWSYYSPGSYTQRDPVLLTVRVFLEGPYQGSSAMSTALQDGDYIPNTSPYPQDLYSVASLPSSIVDWVLIELRSSASGDAIAYKSAFLQNDGYVIDQEGSDDLAFFVDAGDYYVVVKHRNHLTVMSSDAVTVNKSSATTYDFSSGSGQFYEDDEGAKDLGSGVWGMMGGNASNSNQSIYASDLADIKTNILSGSYGYQLSDVNLDSYVFASDYALCKINMLAGGYSPVPNP